MTPEQQEMLAVAVWAQSRGLKTVLIGADDVIEILRRIEELERENARLNDRAESLRRRYEPTMAEWSEDADAQAGACWG